MTQVDGEETTRFRAGVAVLDELMSSPGMRRAQAVGRELQWQQEFDSRQWGERLWMWGLAGILTVVPVGLIVTSVILLNHVSSGKI